MLFGLPNITLQSSTLMQQTRAFFIFRSLQNVFNFKKIVTYFSGRFRMITQVCNFAKNKYTAVLLMSVMKHAIKIYVICKMALFLPLIIKLHYGLAVMLKITMGLFSINVETLVKDI